MPSSWTNDQKTTEPRKANYSPVLLFHGSADPVSGMEDLASPINQAKDASVPHDAQIFGGARHSFTVQGSRDYDAQADQKSWDALQRFLARLD